jgi:hypothetical protein
MLDEATGWDDLITGLHPATRGTKGKSASRLVSVGAARLAKSSSKGWHLRLRPNSPHLNHDLFVDALGATGPTGMLAWGGAYLTY